MSEGGHCAMYDRSVPGLDDFYNGTVKSSFFGAGLILIFSCVLIYCWFSTIEWWMQWMSSSARLFEFAINSVNP